MIVFVYMLDWLIWLLKMTGAVELVALAAAVIFFHEDKARSMECDVPSRWIPVLHAWYDDWNMTEHDCFSRRRDESKRDAGSSGTREHGRHAVKMKSAEQRRTVAINRGRLFV